MLLNTHAAGTLAMMEDALKGLTRPDGSRPLLIAVTQLTSTSPETLKNELLIACINRGGKIIIPSGTDCIMEGDTVIIVTTHGGFDEIDDILA